MRTFASAPERSFGIRDVNPEPLLATTRFRRLLPASYLVPSAERLFVTVQQVLRGGCACVCVELAGELA